MTRMALLLLVALMTTAAQDAQAQARNARGNNAGPAVQAAPAPAVTALNPAMPDRVARPMVAIDPVTLKAEGVEIRLWGIQPAQTNETPLELKAMDLLDQLIAGQVVNCKIEGGTIPVLIGRCTGQSGEDLALSLLNNGLAVRNRRQTYNTAFAMAYGQAEEYARLHRKGVWMYLAEAEQTPEDKEPLSQKTMLGLMIGVPVAGFAGVGLIMWIWLQKIASMQRNDLDRARKKEAVLLQRERSVLLSTLEGELLENKHKIDAFLTVYGDMLADLKNPATTPKYQQVGDIVQKHPSFSKTVFEANANKLSVLGIKLAGKVSKLYAALPKDQEYINLDSNVPLDTAIRLLEKIIDEARAVQPPLEVAIEELQQVAIDKDDLALG